MEVVVAITLEEEVFDAELENKSSARYQEMKENVENEVTGVELLLPSIDRVPATQLFEHRALMREVVSSTLAGPTRGS